MKKSLQEHQDFRHITAGKINLIAHRGMGPTSVLGPTFEKFNIPPENTLESFKRAILEGCDGFELDIFKSQDGKIMVIHDDELCRNLYGYDRKGEAYPRPLNATKVNEKTAQELKQLSVGPHQEKIPELSEVFDLASAANQIRAEENLPPLIINIELKDKTAVKECLDLIKTYAEKHPNSGVDFKSIIFCSFNHDALIALKTKAKHKDIEQPLRISPGIKTATLFGAANIDEKFNLKAGLAEKYVDQLTDEELAAKEKELLWKELSVVSKWNVPIHAENKIQNQLEKNALARQETPSNKVGLAYVERLVLDHEFDGYDTPFYDILGTLVDSARLHNKELHASTSDFRDYSNLSFAKSLLKMSEQTRAVFFKCDNTSKARLAFFQAQSEMRAIGPQLIAIQNLNAETVYSRTRGVTQDPPLDQLIPKPTPYSKTHRPQ